MRALLEPSYLAATDPAAQSGKGGGLAAWELARSNQRLLVGAAGDPRLVKALGEWLASQREVTAVIDLRTMRVGADELLVCGGVDYEDDLSISDVERQMDGVVQRLRERFPDVKHVYLQPTSREAAGGGVTAPGHPTRGTSG